MYKTKEGQYILYLLIYFFSFSLMGQNQKFKTSFIFPFQDKHVHSSSIIALPNGDLMACWFQGSGERKANDVKIMGARLKKDSLKWSKSFIMADTPGHPDCNPVLFIDKNKQLKLYWIVVQANQWESSVLKYRESSNYMADGAPIWDWQDVILLKPGDEFAEKIKKEFKSMESRDLAWAEYAPRYETMVYEAAHDKRKRETGWMTRIHPLVLSNGRILLPLYSDGFNLSLIAISDDGGKTWLPSLPIVGYGNIQPSIVQRKDGSLIAFMRDNGDAPGRVLESISLDDGFSWTAAKKSDIPNPGTSIETIKLINGEWLMVYNDLEDGRHSIAVCISNDEGKTWKWTKNLDKKKDKDEGSFSYPSVIQTKDGIIHLTYSYNVKGNKTIKYVSFKANWVKNK